MPTNREYWRSYYARSRERISETRRERYRTDAEFRKTIRERALARHRRLRVERLKLRAENPQAPSARGWNKPRVVLVKDGHLLLYSLGEFAARLHVDRQTVIGWERKGLLPAPTVTDDLKRRWYSEAYMDTVSGAVWSLRAAGEWGHEKLKAAVAKAVKETPPPAVDVSEAGGAD
jgi:hypothetical protein